MVTRSSDSDPDFFSGTTLARDDHFVDGDIIFFLRRFFFTLEEYFKD